MTEPRSLLKEEQTRCCKSRDTGCCDDALGWRGEGVSKDTQTGVSDVDRYTAVVVG